MSNLNRRDFMKKTLVTGAALGVVPSFALTANGYNLSAEKIRVGIIGTGSRMNLLIDAFLKQPDCTIAALCDVDKTRMEQFAVKFNIKADTYGDYRRILERKDIDAVVVATPDHWHAPITVEACQAGKDVYLEKPVSNTIPAALLILEAARKYNKVVQVGTQQRSWPHFQECSNRIKEGLIGKVNQVVVNHGTGGGYNLNPQPAAQEPIPEGFDWEMWQGPAQRRPYSAARRNWRKWYDYGGGSITDWGVHYIDIVHMVLGADKKAPSFTAAVAMPNTSPELVTNIWSISYKYDDFLMSFESCTQPVEKSQDFFVGGPSFYGQDGYAFVNRSGYVIRPYVTRAYGANKPPEPPFKAIDAMLTYDGADERASEVVHVRNWFDCIKSRQKPTCDIEIGFNSSLPCLLGLQAIKEGRALTWDPNTKTVKI